MSFYLLSQFEFLCHANKSFLFLTTGDDLVGPIEGKEEEQEYVASRKKQFTDDLDINGDGKLDEHEIGQWILPTDTETPSEVKHLIEKADADKVCLLLSCLCEIFFFRFKALHSFDMNT